MSTLQRILDSHHADATATVHSCYAIRPQVPALAVLTADDTCWLLMWNHFVFGHFEPTAEGDTITLKFAGAEVTARGLHLRAILDVVGEMRLSLLRTAPHRYAKTTEAEPFIDSLLVQPIARRSAAPAA